MGLRSSKNKRTYDIAPVVSNKDFRYEKHPRPLPKVELPSVVVNSEKNVQQSEETNVQKVEKTLVAIASPNEKAETNGANDVRDPRIPSWVNENNFMELLLKIQPDIVEINDFQVKPAMAAGENYATLMLRVKITAKLQNESTKNFSFMLKVAHDTKEMQAMLQAMNFFITENAVYNEVIPELEEMYRLAGVDITFGAKCYKLPIEDPNVHYVLLDDLGTDGFKNANRLECLNMEHTLCILKKMAQFHAASACRVAKNGPYDSKIFMPDMDNEMTRAMMGQMFMTFKKPFLDNLKTYNNGEKYYETMENFFDNLVELFVRSRKLLSGFFCALNHGDSWSNNFLFKYGDSGNLKEALLVDFQNTNWCSPALDLLYFIISSVQIDIKLTQFDYFIRYYHEHLTEYLKLLDYPLEVPNLKNFHMQIIDFGPMATMTSFFTLGVVLLDPSDSAKFENFMAETQEGYDFKNAMYSNERYRKYINEILPWLHNRGFMEINLTDLDNRIEATDKLVEPVTRALAPTTKQEEKTEQSLNSYPEWVNESLFIDVVRADYENYQKILKFVVSAATSAGDNYSSIMLKIDIDIELTDNSTRSQSYMLKIPPGGEQARAFAASMHTFEKEIIAYNELVPQYEKVYLEQAGVNVIFSPKSYKLSENTICDTLVLENLRPKGFKNCDRLQGLDQTHTEAVLKKLAEFHAASAYWFEVNGKLPEVVKKSKYTEENREQNERMTKPYYNNILDCMQQYEGKEDYFDNVIEYTKEAVNLMIKAHVIDWSKFNVLNHGDCWTNNIMFQHNDQGDIVNTYFVDFQLIKYGSPAIDLYYFLLTSPKIELKLEYFDYFIRYYHENLKANLELLKYPKQIPSLKELHMELLDNNFWAMYTVMNVMGPILLDPTDMASLDNIIGTGEEAIALKKKMFLSKRYKSHAEAIYPWLNRRGLMDFKLQLTPEPSPPKVSNVPSWVDAEHFEDILKENVNNFDKITNITIRPATQSGDNYASTLQRVKVDFQLKDGTSNTVSYILKLPLQSEQESDMVTKWNFFDKEITMYSKYIREFENMYKEVDIDFVFGPKFYSFKKSVGKDILILEDLAQSGFKCGDRRQGLDMEHAECVLKKLAQFHAASAKYVEVHGPFPEVFQKGIYSEETREMFESISIDYFYDFFKQYKDYEEYKDKLPNLIDNRVDLGINVSAVDPTEFNVLNHGDSWLNNIMFKHDAAGHVDETYFIDFQVCKYGSPTQDLWYFIISSTELGLKVDSFDYFIKYYHDNLLKYLQDLKYSGQVPTLSELHSLLLKYGYTGFNTFVGIGAICLLESSEDATIGNFSADTEEGAKFRKSLYLNDKYMAQAAVVLPWLARRGCLD